MKFKLPGYVLLLLGLLGLLLIERKGHTNSDRWMQDVASSGVPVSGTDTKDLSTMGTDSVEKVERQTKAGEIDPAFPRSWFTDEGYTRQDIEDAKQLMLKEGLSGDQRSDPGTIRRYLLPRVTTMVQITNLTLQTTSKSNTPIPFTIEGEVPTPEFNFVRFETSIQGDLIIIRALGHSAAFTDENLGRPSRMLPVKLNGTLDPLPAGTYRISIPELGLSGIRILMVE